MSGIKAINSEDPILPGKRRKTKCTDRIFTPFRLLIYFATVNFFTYFDRGAIAGTLAKIKIDPQIQGHSSAHHAAAHNACYKAPPPPPSVPSVPSTPSPPSAPVPPPTPKHGERSLQAFIDANPDVDPEEFEEIQLAEKARQDDAENKARFARELLQMQEEDEFGNEADFEADPLPTPTPTHVSELDGSLSGLLGSGFMLGFMVFCPLFAWAANYFNPIRLVAIGLIGWCVATLGCGAAPNYPLLLIGRIVTGMGEASFVGIAPTLLDNVAPGSKRTIWFAIFYCTIPVGQAAGMAVAAIMAGEIELCSPFYIAGWRTPFICECFCMLPLALLSLCIPDSYNIPKSEQETDDDDEEALMKVEKKPMPTEPITLWRAIKELGTNPFFVCTCYGYSAYTFVIGGIAFWAPDYVTSNLHISNATGSAIFGGITVVTGLGGTALGGVVMDKIGGSRGIVGVKMCALFGAICFATCFPFGFLALFIPNKYSFFTLIFVAESIVFLPTSSTNTMLITMVPSYLRTYAMSINVFCIHLLGDFPSPYLTGWMKDRIQDMMDAHMRSENHNQPLPPPSPSNPDPYKVPPMSVALTIVWCVMLPCFLAYAWVWRMVKKRPEKLAAIINPGSYD
eukprot:TRINITY_DN67240_c14_g1_i1.p1 TRINITY_DN67240_c14_g1~~TRINITY_DN67240_c14_g1_i1.p1  ORF type:complete len:653 (+),score=54.42 TRINITY_DN67240_c14_g1_i1:93-1961(+)